MTGVVRGDNARNVGRHSHGVSSVPGPGLPVLRESCGSRTQRQIETATRLFTTRCLNGIGSGNDSWPTSPQSLFGPRMSGTCDVVFVCSGRLCVREIRGVSVCPGASAGWGVAFSGV